MDLTKGNEEVIDSLSYKELLSIIRFAPIGDPWVLGETGEHIEKRMKTLRALPDGEKNYVKASKEIGWDPIAVLALNDVFKT